jgi:hypothetical protein
MNKISLCRDGVEELLANQHRPTPSYLTRHATERVRFIHERAPTPSPRSATVLHLGYLTRRCRPRGNRRVQRPAVAEAVRGLVHRPVRRPVSTQSYGVRAGAVLPALPVSDTRGTNSSGGGTREPSMRTT